MPVYDVLIRNGLIVDGSGSEPTMGDVAIQGDMIAAVGEVAGNGRFQIDAHGAAISPGFINMMCWANESLIADGRSQSDIRQGVTLEVLGEGWSMGPVNDKLKAYMKARQGDIRYEIEWDTLDGYLQYLVQRGVSPNVGSFVGAGGIRAYVVGFDDRRPTPDELAQMQSLVRQAMAEGALGLSSALIYAPDMYAHTAELIALAQAAAEVDGIYITHLRSEGARFLEALDEFFTIVEQADIRGEIYHLKAAGRRNWHKLAEVIRRVEAKRAAGWPITADMYPYRASSTGLDALMPGWALEGGHDAWVARLKEPETRARVLADLRYTGDDRENLFMELETADNILLTAFKNDALKPFSGKTLTEVAALRGQDPLETALDLIIEDDSRVGTVFFSISEENVRREVGLPWVSFCSDSASLAAEGVFLNTHPHPRAYGAFARVFAKYVRNEGVMSLAEAVRRMSALPAANLKLDRRGRLQSGYFADVVVFDPDTVQDHATFAQPHQYATGVQHVLVNGVSVIWDGEHTGARPGRVVRGPGWRG
ncbi:MAG: amidohydrolase family protein [Anaerolineae bacterium]